MNVHNPRRQRSSKNTRQVVGRPKPNRDHHHKQQGNREEKLSVILTSRQVLRQICRNLFDFSHVFLSAVSMPGPQSGHVSNSPREPGISSGCPVSQALTVSDRKSTRLNSSHLGISYAVF